jgi:hypothetical protein
MADPEYEPVSVFAEWCDGPRSGLAFYCGRPHLFVSLWLDDEDNPVDDWAVVPAASPVVSALLDRLRPAAHEAGAATLYPGLGREQWEAFYGSWSVFKADVLAADGEAVRGVGDMRPLGDQPPRSDGFDPLEVRWMVRGVVPIAAVRERLAALARERVARRPAGELLAGEEMPF